MRMVIQARLNWLCFTPSGIAGQFSYLLYRSSLMLCLATSLLLTTGVAFTVHFL